MKACVALLAAAAMAAADTGERTILDDLVRQGLLIDAPETPIFRMELDVTGDDRQELFLASQGASYGQDWTIYTPLLDGSYRRLGDLSFGAAQFHFDRRERLLVHYLRFDVGHGRYVQFRVAESGIHEVRRIGDTEAARRIASWGQRPLVWSTTLRALRVGPPVLWQSVGARHSQRVLSALGERVRK